MIIVMKILIIRGYPDQLHLDQYNVQEVGLATALRKQGHFCDIILWLGEGKNHIEVLEDGTKIYWRRGLNILKNGVFPGIRKIAGEYDVIQVHEYDQLQSWLFYTFPHKQKIVLYHGPYYHPFNKGYNLKCWVFDHTLLPLSSDRKNLPCIAKSPLAKEFLEKKKFNNITTVGVGLNSDVLGVNENDIIIKNNNSKVFELLYVGKLEPRRNTDFLLSVFDKIASRRNDVHLTIVGNGEEAYVKMLRPQMDLLRKKDLLTQYTSLNQKDLKEIYEKSDLMIFPTNYDIFGMVLLEAMYFGVPCVSSVNGGSSQLIQNGENGMLIDKLVEEVWIEQICDVLDKPELISSMKNSAMMTIRNSFTWDAIAERFLYVYQ